LKVYTRSIWRNGGEKFILFNGLLSILRAVNQREKKEYKKGKLIFHEANSFKTEKG